MDHLVRLAEQLGVVGVRGFPNGIFIPWARWNTWPDLGQEFFRRRRRRRRPGFWKSREWNLEIGNLKIWDRQNRTSFSGLPDDADRSVSKM